MDWSTYNIIDDKERDLSYKNIMEVNYHIAEGRIPLRLLNAESVEEFYEVLNIINTPRWADTNEDGLFDNISKADMDKYLSSKPATVNFNYDFDAYCPDIKRIFGIDLRNDNPSWFEFMEMLNSICIMPDTLMQARIKYRSYEASKDETNEYKSYMNRMKSMYKI